MISLYLFICSFRNYTTFFVNMVLKCNKKNFKNSLEIAKFYRNDEKFLIYFKMIKDNVILCNLLFCIGDWSRSHQSDFYKSPSPTLYGN